MKRMVVLVAFTGGLLLLSSAVALAAINSIECPGGECLGPLPRPSRCACSL